MRNEHILDILDAKAFGEFNQAERNSIENHAAHCRSCRQAYEAAKISSVLLKTGAAQYFEPSPFFQTRVLANLREKQVKINPLSAFARIWRASGTLVVMMITTVFALIALTVFAPGFNKVSGASASALDNDSADIVILDGKMPTKEPTNEQVFQLVYGTENNTDK
jgi:hypothetical protein